jgi:glutamate-1-semialdehyde 2,1-aminomutase
MAVPVWLEEFARQRPKCKALFERAKACIAGGVGHDMRYSLPCPTYVQRASGARMWDMDGNEIIDCGLGNGAILLGHAPPAVLEAIGAALENGFHFGQDHPLQVEWAELIQKAIPSAERVRFVNSGTEGAMLSVRLARAFKGCDKILRFEGHFSGWHDDVGRGATPPFDAPVSLGIPATRLETTKIVPADLNVVEETLRAHGDIAAVMLEPSGGSWGTVPLSVEFNRELRRITEAHDVLLIYDEVVTGFRYSAGGYQQYAGVTPDLTVMGKIVAGGMPGGVVAGRADIMGLLDFSGDPRRDRHQRVQHLGTFNASPLSAAAGIATLKQTRSGVPQARADGMAGLLRSGMEELLERERASGYVYGDASIFHVYLEAAPGSGAASRSALHRSDAATLKGIPGNVVRGFQKNLQIRGVELLSYTGGMTSAAHTEADVSRILEAFGEAIHALVEARLVASLS